MLLAIETSCDETSAAVLDVSGRVLSCVVRSQVERHAPYGGVVPELAARDHLAALPVVYREALERAEISADRLTALAVTRGPGLQGALLVGIQFARTLAAARNLPLYAVNHLVGHLAAGDIETPMDLPAVALLVSGGHTLLLEVRERWSVRELGGTVDDAVGEAYDKVAKLLDLGYPGGPEVSTRAESGNPRRFGFPRPLADSGDGRISLSGLKTAVVRTVRGLGPDQVGEAVDDLCASFEEAVIDMLARKIEWAIDRVSEVRSLLLTGGVAANRSLRVRAAEVAAAHGLRFFVPRPAWCTDNAAMIGTAALPRWRQGIPGDSQLEPLSRWSPDPDRS